MTYGTFIRKNALRNKRRTSLTVLSIGFSLFLLITLQTILNALTNPPETEASALRLVVRSATSGAIPLPISLERKLAKVPHVTAVSPMIWFGGVYKDPKNNFTSWAVRHEEFFKVFSNMEFSPGAEEAFEKEKMGAIAGMDLMEEFGWEIGDLITLLGPIFGFDLEFKIIGTYQAASSNAGFNNSFYFRFDYFEDAQQYGGVAVPMYWLVADSAGAVPGIIDTVDEMFRNTPNETKTETARSFQLEYISMLGNIQLMVGSIVSVVVFTMLLVAGSTMAMTIRERLREVAILKAIGYSRRVLLSLILGEAVLIAFLGGVVGCILAFALTRVDLARFTGGFLSTFQPNYYIMAGALGAGIVIGLVSGLIPALRASGMTVSAAMRLLD